MGIHASSPLQHLYFSNYFFIRLFSTFVFFKITIAFVSTGEVTTMLRSHASRGNNAYDQLDSNVAMDENNQINATAHNTKGVLLI